MNKKHLENLKKLANFLEKKVTNKQFNIAYIRAYEGGGDWCGDGLNGCSFKSKNECGTIGCAIGWAPFVVPTYPKDFRVQYAFFSGKSEHSKVLDFDDYSTRVFGVHINDGGAGDYMFSSNWARSPKQKTRMAAVRRIREVIANGGELSDRMIAKADRCGLHIVYSNDHDEVDYDLAY